MSTTRLFGIALMMAVVVGCVEHYNPPPEVTLRQPETGTFFEGDPITLDFSEPIDPGSFAIRVWSGERDIENELTATTPRLARCQVQSSPCGTTTVSLSEDNLSATVVLDPEDLGRADVPLVLEVLDELKDRDGVKRGISAWFDFQFKPAQGMVLDEPVEFENGVYIVVGTTQEPLPVVLTLVTDFKVLPDGRLVFAAAEGDEIPPAVKNTTNPEEIEVDSTDQGFAVLGTGQVVVAEGGTRFMETDPVDISLALGPIGVLLEQVRITGEILPNAETGHDRIEGIISFSNLTVIAADVPTEYGASNAPYTADFVEPELIPAGAPELCGEVCGAVTTSCDPPAEFPPAEFCEDPQPGE